MKKQKKLLGRSSLFESSRKGNAVMDTTTILLVLFVSILAVIVAKVLFNDLNDDVQNDTSLSNSTKQLVASQNTAYSSLMDNGFMIIFVGLWIVMLASAFFSDTHPIFFVITIILMIGVLVIGAVIGNTYEEILEDDDFNSIEDDFPKSHRIMSNLLVVTIIISFTITLALFGKKRNT